MFASKPHIVVLGFSHNIAWNTARQPRPFDASIHKFNASPIGTSLVFEYEIRMPSVVTTGHLQTRGEVTPMNQSKKSRATPTP
jgi:hypothetical protein